MMAFFRVNFGVLQRTKGGDALRRSAYQRCARENGFDYSAKANELTDVFMMMPDGAPAWAHDPHQLWSKLEAAEKRKDAQVGRTIEITIPREVPDELRSDFIRHCLEPIRRKGMAAEIALHNEIGFDKKEQPHAHILLTMRKLTDDGFSNKVRSWNTDFTAEKGKRMRKQFADRMNQFFEAHNIAAKVDHRSYAERGVQAPRVPEIPKKYWKQWERNPDAPPPKPIADYFAWKSERNREVRAYLKTLKELKHEQQRHQNQRAEATPAAKQSSPANPRGGAGSAQHSERGARVAEWTTRGERRGRPHLAADRTAYADATAAQSD